MRVNYLNCLNLRSESPSLQTSSPGEIHSLSLIRFFSKIVFNHWEPILRQNTPSWVNLLTKAIWIFIRIFILSNIKHQVYQHYFIIPNNNYFSLLFHAVIYYYKVSYSIGPTYICFRNSTFSCSYLVNIIAPL